jgi:site-specific recombinase XerD
VTHLRKITLEELERRNYTQSTTRAYLRTIDEFARHFNRPPDQLGPEQIREYVAHLFRDRKLADRSLQGRQRTTIRPATVTLPPGIRTDSTTRSRALSAAKEGCGGF